MNGKIYCEWCGEDLDEDTATCECWLDKLMEEPEDEPTDQEVP